MSWWNRVFPCAAENNCRIIALCRSYHITQPLQPVRLPPPPYVLVRPATLKSTNSFDQQPNLNSKLNERYCINLPTTNTRFLPHPPTFEHLKTDSSFYLAFGVKACDGRCLTWTRISERGKLSYFKKDATASFPQHVSVLIYNTTYLGSCKKKAE